MSTLVTLLLVLCALGVGWWAINQLSLPPPLRMVAVVIVALVAIAILLQLAPSVA